MTRRYYVYILASRSRNIYTGVTNSLPNRLVQHRSRTVPGFTSKYRIFRLVHCEVFTDIRAAISREKEIKAWRREKKIRLIQQKNPTWEDLAERWFPNIQGLKALDVDSAKAEPETNGEADPSSAKFRPRSG
jgi:putative endonuclease